MKFLLHALHDVPVIDTAKHELYDSFRHPHQQNVVSVYVLLLRRPSWLGTVQEIFEQLAKGVADIINVSYVFLLAVYQRESNRLDFHVLDNGQYRELFDQPVQGGCGWVIREQQALLVRKLSAEAPKLPVVFTDFPGSELLEQALVFVPLLVGEQCVGVLSTQHSRPFFFDDEDQQILSLLGNHVALALHNLRLFESLRQLNETGQYLTSLLDSQQVLDNVVERIHAITRADYTVLYPYVSQQGQFEPPLEQGTLQSPEHPRSVVPRRDDIVLLTVQRNRATFAPDSNQLYELLGGDPSVREAFEQAQAVVREPETLLPHALFAKVQTSYQHSHENIVVLVEIAGNTAPINAIPHEVADVLRNLYVNAVQAMSNGGTITLRARNNGNFVDLQVIDTGIGIPKNYLRRVFELYYSTKGSSGFGLWSARQYALANGGDLTVESEVGKGTTFTLLLPRAVSSEPSF